MWVLLGFFGLMLVLLGLFALFALGTFDQLHLCVCLLTSLNFSPRKQWTHVRWLRILVHEPTELDSMF